MDKSKPKYILEFASDVNKLNEKINEHLNNGYILYGFPFRSDSYRYQAVILPETQNES